MNIPGGIDVPGAELVYRVHDMVPDPETLIVVNCAGRTRSIIGAQSLINAGVPNHVVALENGTMGWHLAGFDLEHGCERVYAENSDSGLAAARDRAEAVAARFGVRGVDWDTYEGWRDDAARTTYLLDVRSPKEYRAGHLPGAKPAPGGQLVQATDEYVGVRRSRLVLTDDDGVRATMSASWLIQMGWDDVFVLDGSSVPADRKAGPWRPPVLGIEDVACETVSAAELSGSLGLGPSINTSDDHGIAQAAHGSAPDIAGRGIANPTALMLSVAILLDWLGARSGREEFTEASRLLDAAVEATLADSACHTGDLGGKATTREFGEAALCAIETEEHP